MARLFTTAFLACLALSNGMRASLTEESPQTALVQESTADTAEWYSKHCSDGTTCLQSSGLTSTDLRITHACKELGAEVEDGACAEPYTCPVEQGFMNYMMSLGVWTLAVKERCVLENARPKNASRVLRTPPLFLELRFLRSRTQTRTRTQDVCS
jgi:hypothetical protein